MRLIKSIRKKVENPASIVKKGNRYFYSDNGEAIGELVDLTVKEYHDIMLGHYSSEVLELIKEFNIDQIYFRNDSNRNYDEYGNTYKIYVFKKNVIVNDLGFGAFYLKAADGDIFFEDFKSEINHGNIIKNKTLKEDILNFFADKSDSGRKKKKGFLLYGSPGNGKSSEIMSLFPIAEEMKFRIFVVSRKVDFEWLNSMKGLLEGDNTIFVLEEITQRTDSDGTEELLTFLDGEYSWNNSVVIATTNYPGDLPDNLVDRPGRFDTFIEYGPPTNADIISLGAKYGFTEADSLALAGKDLSFDYVSFIMSQAKINNITVTEALDKETKKKRLISTTFKSKIGMGL